MAEANQQQTSQQNAGQAAAQAAAAANTLPGTQQAQQTQQSDQEPKWLSSIQNPTEREEAKKSYLLHSDYTKKTQTIADERKTWDTEKQKLQADTQKWNDWYQQQYQPFYTLYQKNKPQIDAILSGQAATQQQQAQSQNNANQSDPFENYDLLPPQEQAKRLADYVGNQVLSQQLQAMEQKMVQALNQKEQFFANYLTILTDAYGRKFQNPDLDMNQYIQKALEISQGKFNPLEQAYQTVTSESSQKRMQEDWMKKGREEAALEYKNQQQSNGALQQPFVPIFKQKPETRAQIRETVRNEALGKGISWNNGSSG
jgi:hypothetical protein